MSTITTPEQFSELSLADARRLRAWSGYDRWAGNVGHSDDVSVDIEDDATILRWQEDMHQCHEACWPDLVTAFNNDPANQGEDAVSDFSEALAAGRYHPDMLPLMERISEAADSAGYCAEYDRLARAVGAPTRAEVRTLVRERDGQRYRITRYIQIPVVVEVSTREGEEDARAEAQRATQTWNQIADLLAAQGKPSELVDLIRRDPWSVGGLNASHEATVEAI